MTPQIESQETRAAKEAAERTQQTLRKVSTERDELRRIVQADHRQKAAIGGAPCVCKWCSRV